MSRLNKILHLVTDPKYKNTFHAISTPDPYIKVGVTSSSNALVLLHYSLKNSSSIRYIIPKEKVIQIVTGFSEIA